MNIYYFSGTGNSLYTARLLAGSVPGARAVPILSVESGETRLSGPSGIVFPVYMFRLPRLVEAFLEGLRGPGSLFAVAVCGGEVGGVFSDIRRLTRRAGITLDSAFKVTLPSNYLPFGEAPAGAVLEDLYESADQTISRIAETLTAGERFSEPQTDLYRRMVYPGLLYAMGYRFMKNLDRQFAVDGRCTGCGMCAEVCPVGNITLSAGRPVWHHGCEQCFGCVNLCPEEAIQAGARTEGLRRYRNPRVSVREIIDQKRGAAGTQGSSLPSAT